MLSEFIPTGKELMYVGREWIDLASPTPNGHTTTFKDFRPVFWVYPLKGRPYHRCVHPEAQGQEAAVWVYRRLHVSAWPFKMWDKKGWEEKEE